MDDRERTKQLEDALRLLRDASAEFLADVERVNAIAGDAERGRALRELMRTKLRLASLPKK